MQTGSLSELTREDCFAQSDVLTLTLFEKDHGFLMVSFSLLCDPQRTRYRVYSCVRFPFASIWIRIATLVFSDRCSLRILPVRPGFSITRDMQLWVASLLPPYETSFAFPRVMRFETGFCA